MSDDTKIETGAAGPTRIKTPVMNVTTPPTRIKATVTNVTPPPTRLKVAVSHHTREIKATGYMRPGTDTTASAAPVELMTMRIRAEDKAMITRAAVQSGKTLSDFVVRAALEKAGGVSLETGASFEGVPSFFYGLVAAARRGGRGGYENAGYGIAMHLHDLQPNDLQSDDQWDDALDTLKGLLAGTDTEAVLAWFDRWYLRCMELVPKNRRGQFLAGVERANLDERINA